MEMQHQACRSRANGTVTEREAHLSRGQWS